MIRLPLPCRALLAVLLLSGAALPAGAQAQAPAGAKPPQADPAQQPRRSATPAKAPESKPPQATSTAASRPAAPAETGGAGTAAKPRDAKASSGAKDTGVKATGATAAAAAAAPSAAKPGDAKAADPKAKPTTTTAARTAAGPGGGQAALLATFGDWSTYATPGGGGRTRLCYALTQPKDREPKTLPRDPGYLFVSFRPAENVRNEVAFMMGFPTKDNGAAEAVIGPTTYALVTKDQNAWVKNPAEETQVIATMARGQNLVVKAASRKGNGSTDRYSLTGFGQALDRARKECS